MQRMTKEERAIRDADFKAREKPRMVWPSTSEGTVMRVHAENEGKRAYVHRPLVKKVKVKLTEAQDNALGRAHRRRQNKFARGWLPHAKR